MGNSKRDRAFNEEIIKDLKENNLEFPLKLDSESWEDIYSIVEEGMWSGEDGDSKWDPDGIYDLNKWADKWKEVVGPAPQNMLLLVRGLKKMVDEEVFGVFMWR